MSVRRAQSEIDSAEFSEWCAFSNIKPFYFDTTEYMLSVIASILVNTHRKKNAKPLKPEDFLPKYSSTHKDYDTPEDMELKLRALFSGNNK